MSSGRWGGGQHHRGRPRASSAVLGPGQFVSGGQRSSGSAAGGDEEFLPPEGGSERHQRPAHSQRHAGVKNGCSESVILKV